MSGGFDATTHSCLTIGEDHMDQTATMNDLNMIQQSWVTVYMLIVPLLQSIHDVTADVCVGVWR